MCASTSIVLPGSRPTTSTPEVVRLRRAAERDEQHVGLGVGRRRSCVTVTVPSAACATRSAFCAGADVDAAARAAPRSPGRRRTPPRCGSSRRSPSISVTWLPSVWKACDISTPTTPPPRITSRSGISLGGRRLAVGPGAVDRVQALDRRHRSASSRRRGTTARLASISSSPTRDAPLAGEPAAAADQLDPAVLEPRQLRGVVEVVDDLVAPGEHRRDVELAGHRLGRAGDPLDLGQRLVRAAAAPSTACTPSTSTRRRRAGPRRSPPSGRARPSRPAATSPAGPAPSTTTSKLRMHRHPNCHYNGGAQLPGDDRLRRGRFVGSVASRGTGGLVKPRHQQMRTLALPWR